MPFLLVATFYRVTLYLKCPAMGSFAIHCGSTSIMSLSNIHGSVMSALLGVLVLHLSLLVLKLPPAGFYTLKEKKNPNTNY